MRFFPDLASRALRGPEEVALIRGGVMNCEHDRPGDEIRSPGAMAIWSDFCAVAPSPELKERLKTDLADARTRSGSPLAHAFSVGKGPRRLGFDDGVIIPPDHFPV